VFESTLKLAATPLKVTSVAPAKFAPVIVTLAPTSPLDGVKELIAGATIKSVLLVPVPAGVVTAIGPVVAPPGTVAVIWVAESTVKPAAAPWKVTSVAPVKFTPVIVTLTPTCPLGGVKELMAGAGTTVTVVVPSVTKVPAAALKSSGVGSTAAGPAVMENSAVPELFRVTDSGESVTPPTVGAWIST